MIGFKTGVALHLASTQLPKLCGVPAGHDSFWHRMADFFRHLGEINPASLALGLAALGVLVLGKRLLPNKPVALFVVAAGIVASSFFDFGAMSVKLIGEVPQGLPAMAVPAVSYSDIRNMLPLALACFLLASVETAAIGRMFAARHGHRFDPNREFLALAASNVAAGLFRGFPVGGGMSQSLVNESGGAKTPASGLFAALAILLVALFFSGLLSGLPQPVLAAVVLMAVASLAKIEDLRWLWRHHRGEFLVAVASLAGVLGAGLLQGVLIGAIISLLLLLRQAAHPHVAELGRIPGTEKFSDRERHKGNEVLPGVFPFRVEANIMYFNADNILADVLARVEARGEPIRLAIGDLSASPKIDIAGAHMLKRLHAELAKRGTTLRLVQAHASARDLLRIEGVEDVAGPIDRSTSVAEAAQSGL
jgi:MFS superfamily sulfate permease-like transporter